MKKITTKLMKILKIIILPVFVLGLFSCKDKTELTAIVQTVKASNGIPVSSVNILIKPKSEGTLIYLPEGEVSKITGLTDSKGEFVKIFRYESIVDVIADKIEVRD